MTDSQPSQWITDVSDETFQECVFEASKKSIIVVDFWADWCGPCRMLGPILESLAEEYAGKFVLVKANTDNNQQAAAAFKVAGIPAVFAVVDGEIVNSFEGVLPEVQIRQWLDGLLVGRELAAAKDVLAEDPKAAEASLRGILETSPDNVEAQIGLAEVLLDTQRPEEATSMLEVLEARGFLEPEAQRLKARLSIQTGASIILAEARQRAEDTPSDLSLQFELARGLAANQQYQAALEICVDIVPLDRKGVGEQARELMVQIFQVLPEGDPLTTEFRQQLSMALY